MSDPDNQELIDEIEAFRADLRRRSMEHARRNRMADPLDLPSIDVSCLAMAQIRALVSSRYADARFEHRLRDVERRLAEIETQRG